MDINNIISRIEFNIRYDDNNELCAYAYYDDNNVHNMMILMCIL